MTTSDFDSIRKGEAETPSMRTDRLYRADGKWFIRTRESEDIGPYDSYKEVTQTIPLFAEFARNLSGEHIETLIENQNTKIEKRLRSKGTKKTEKPTRTKGNGDKRIFSSHQSWYYQTKDGKTLGPYDSKKDAKKVSALFKEFSSSLSERKLIKLLDEFIFD